jgi:DNA-binding SARP family transcriptional activator
MHATDQTDGWCARPKLSLLQGFELTDGATVVPVARSSQRLLAFVALHDRPLLRVHVSGVLWLDAAEPRASASLRTTLWRTPAPGGVPLIEATSTHVWLNPDVEVDFRTCVAEATSLIGGADAVPEAIDWAEKTSGLRGELLPDWYEDWVLIERERFRQLRLHALERICQHLTAIGRYSDALQAGLAAVAAEPMRESAHRQVITVHLREGNASEALRQYHEYKRLIASELGLSPSPAMEQLIGSLRAVT